LPDTLPAKKPIPAMQLVATLISDPRSPRLDDPLVGKAARAVNAVSVDWLASGIACDLLLPAGAEHEDAEAALRCQLRGMPVDSAVQPAEGRRKKVLLADMDSTMIGQECIDELADLAGVRDRVAAITARSMNGEIAFEEALRERVALLEGLPVSVISEVLDKRISLAPGARELVATMRSAGAWTALVSGGFTAFTGPVSAMLGFHEHRANVLLERDGVLSGTVAEPILGREAKAEALRSISAGLGIPASEVIAVGDGANDLAMLALAGLGVALHAKPAVAAKSRIRIDHGDLTALLYLQGYRRAEFAA
jgi:phosphoserine phosphatase